MNYLLIILLPFLTLFASGQELTKQYEPVQTLVLPIDSNSTLKNYYERIEYADVLLSNVDFAFSIIKDGNKQSIEERPVILACLDNTTYLWHVVSIYLPYPAPKEYFAELRKAQSIEEREAVHIKIRVATDGYLVEHVKGIGAARLSVKVYRVTDSTKIPLTVYRMKFSNFRGNPSKNFVSIEDNVQAIHYTPISDNFINKEFENEGKNFLRKHIVSACDSLRNLGVPSASYSGKLLGNVFPVEVLMSLMVSEQWDPLYFKRDTVKSLSNILCEYGLNRELSFAWSVSKARAIGCLQFTNSKGNGTYATVVRAYDKAMLNKDFEAGSRDMHNVIKAAICLLDLELSNSSKSLDLFLKDPVLGSVHPIAAYNGGQAAGYQMLKGIESLNGESFDKVDISSLKIPYAIKSSSKRKGAPKNTETPMYVTKYFYLMEQFQLKQIE